MENQLECLLMEEKLPLSWCYRIVETLKSHLPSSCEACGYRHKIITYLSFTSKPCSHPSRTYLFCSEFILFLLYYGFFLRFGTSYDFMVLIPLLILFHIITVVDFRYYIIPDELNFLGVALGLTFSAIGQFLPKGTQSLDGLNMHHVYSISNSLLGVLLGAGLLFSIAYLGSMLLKRDAMGGGDIKLSAFIGAFLGYKTTLLALALSSVLGSAFGLVILIKSRWVDKKQGFTLIAYGPYIILATLLVFYLGEDYILTEYQAFSEAFVRSYLR